MRPALLFAALVALTATTGPASAQAPYQRMRTGAGDWEARGGHQQSWRGGFAGGFGSFYNPFFVAPPIVAGSWYQRPYPYHFDYYRYRWAGAQDGAAAAPSPSADCPCDLPMDGPQLTDPAE